MFGLTSDGSSDLNSLSGVYASNQIRARAYENGTTNTNTNLGRSTLGFANNDDFREALFTFVIKAEKSNPAGNSDTVTVFVNPDLSFGSSENAGLGSVSAARNTQTDTLSSFFFPTGGSLPPPASAMVRRPSATALRAYLAEPRAMARHQNWLMGKASNTRKGTS